MTPLQQLCLHRGLRLTEHRRIVLEVLEAATDHPCAREIHRRAATGHRIGLATVYRTLNSLAAVGLVRRHVFRDGKARYEGADGLRPGRSSRLATASCQESRRPSPQVSATGWSTTG